MANAVSDRVRREPSPFRVGTIARSEWLTPRMVRITLAGPEIVGFAVDRPAASLRLLIPSPGAAALEIPTWRGNEFLLSEGRRPVIRTLTPLRVDSETGRLDLDVVVAHSGRLADWVRDVLPGAEAAVSGPGRGYDIDEGAAEFLLVGDETAMPAIGQLLDRLPESAGVRVIVEIGSAEARRELPSHPGASYEWIVNEGGGRPAASLAARVAELELERDARVWVAGEAAAMQQIRNHLFKTLGLPRSVATVRGYWKFGRAAPG